MKFTPRHIAWPVLLPILLMVIAMVPASIRLAAQGQRDTLAAAGKDALATAKPKAKTAAPKKVVKKSVKKGPPPTPAKMLFGAAKGPAPLAARAIGFYAKGCLAGAKSIAVDGPAWQVMRLSRNRMWGHPTLITLVERLAKDVKANDGWPGLLIGDISQPRGGPMITGHASHQIGLDADIWLTPMPDHKLSRNEREDMSATWMLADDRLSINPKNWTQAHGRIITRAASYPEVERVLVNPVIKKAICEDKTLPREHLNKIRPYWGHDYHMHVRIACPKDSPTCTPQPVVGNEDGCGKEVDDWIALFKRIYAPRPKPDPKIAAPKPKPKPKPPEVTLADLPPECRMVIGDTAPPGPSPVADVTKPDAAKTANPGSDAENAAPAKPTVTGSKK